MITIDYSKSRVLYRLLLFHNFETENIFKFKKADFLNNLLISLVIGIVTDNLRLWIEMHDKHSKFHSSLEHFTFRAFQAMNRCTALHSALPPPSTSVLKSLQWHVQACSPARGYDKGVHTGSGGKGKSGELSMNSLLCTLLQVSQTTSFPAAGLGDQMLTGTQKLMLSSPQSLHICMFSHFQQGWGVCGSMDPVVAGFWQGSTPEDQS